MGKLGITIPKNAFAKGREALKESGDFNDVELAPGRYVCIVKGGRGIEAKGTPKIVIDLEVAGEAEQAGGRISVWYGLDEEKAQWLLRDLTKLGYEIEDLDEDRLAEILEELETNQPVVRVTAKKSGDYTNYRIDKLLPELTASEVRAGEGGGGEDTSGNAADEDAGGGKAGLKPGKGKKKDEPEPEAEEEKSDKEKLLEALGNMERPELKAYITDNELEVSFSKKTTDDELRTLIADAKYPDEGEGEDEGQAADKDGDSSSDEGVDVKPGLKCKASIKGKVVPVTVVKVDEAAGKVTVKTAAGNVTVPMAQLSL